MYLSGTLHKMSIPSLKLFYRVNKTLTSKFDKHRYVPVSFKIRGYITCFNSQTGKFKVKEFVLFDFVSWKAFPNKGQKGYESPKTTTKIHLL